MGRRRNRGPRGGGLLRNARGRPEHVVGDLDHDVPVESNDFEIDLPGDEIEFSLYMSGRPKDVPADMDTRTVQPGGTLVGSVVFDVPKDQPMKVAYAPVLKDLAHWS